MSRVPCGKTTGHGDSCVEGHLCDPCVTILRLRLVIVDLIDVCNEAQKLTDLIVGSPPDAQIGGRIESLAFTLGHHPYVMNPDSIDIVGDG